MKTLEAWDSNVTEIERLLQTYLQGSEVCARTANGEQTNLENWRNVIGLQLLKWGKDPASVADEGVEPPTVEAIQWAHRIARALGELGSPAPHRLVPNGEGGLVFERRSGPIFETIEVNAQGSIDMARFENSRLCGRRHIR